MANKAAKKSDDGNAHAFEAQVLQGDAANALRVQRHLQNHAQSYPHQANQVHFQVKQNPGQPMDSVSVPAEPLLPEDDLSAFFRSRAVVAKSADDSTGALLRFLVFVILLPASFVFAYNVNLKFRRLADEQAMRWFALPLREFVPEVKKIWKVDPKSLPKKRVSATMSVGSISNEPLILDGVFLLVRNGQWREVEVKLQGKCPTWDATSDCALKAFFSASRGYVKSAQAMFSVSPERVLTLKPIDRVFWNLSAAMVAGETDREHVYFRRALVQTPVASYEIRRIIFDELVVANALAKKPKEISYYLNEARKDPSAPFWGTSFVKWSALETLAASPTGELTASVMDELVARERGSLRTDPRSLILLGPAFIRAGRASDIVTLTGDASADAVKRRVDAELARPLLLTHVRVLWALGKRNEAVATLTRHSPMIGRHPVAIHYLTAAAVLQGGRPELLAKTLKLLPPLSGETPWETLYLSGLLNIRLGQFKKVSPILQTLTFVKGSEARRDSAALLRAEYLLGVRDYAAAIKILEPKSKKEGGSVFASELLYKSYMALGRERQAAAIRLKTDDAKSKVGYWSSPEMLNSPLGPLALLR